jgi:hypothetical protein
MVFDSLIVCVIYLCRLGCSFFLDWLIHVFFLKYIYIYISIFIYFFS